MGMGSTAEGLALTIGEMTLPIECLDPESERRLRAQLQQGAQQRVTLTPAPGEEQDVEGHTLAASLRSVLVHVNVGTAGQTQPVRVHFPTAQDADHFRRNLIAAGLLAGTLAIGSIGVASMANSGAASGASDANQIVDGWQPAQAAAQAARSDQLAGQVTDGWAVQAPSSDRLAAQVTDGWAAQTPSSDELAAKVTDGWAAQATSSDRLAAEVTDGWMASGIANPAQSTATRPDTQGGVQEGADLGSGGAASSASSDQGPLDNR